MTIRFEDCPPALKAAIEAQLTKEQLLTPATRYVLCQRTTANFNLWLISPLTDNLKLVLQLARAACLASPAAAHQTSKGMPPAMVVEIVTQPPAMRQAGQAATQPPTGAPNAG